MGRKVVERGMGKRRGERERSWKERGDHEERKTQRDGSCIGKGVNKK